MVRLSCRAEPDGCKKAAERAELILIHMDPEKLWDERRTKNMHRLSSHVMQREKIRMIVKVALFDH